MQLIKQLQHSWFDNYSIYSLNVLKSQWSQWNNLPAKPKFKEILDCQAFSQKNKTAK